MIDQRKQIALAQLDAVIDVLSAWRGRYEDDDRRAGLGWICAVLPGSEPEGGWLYNQQNQKVFGWDLHGGIWRFHAAVKFQWPLTRREFRKLASDCGVCLPARHATIFLSESEGSL